MALAAVAQFTERRIGRKRHETFTLADFRAIPHTHERNLHLSELADLSGFTQAKLLSLIPEHLDAFKPHSSRSGKQIHQAYFVTYKEARRFLKDLRLI